MNDLLFFLKITLSFLPFLLFLKLDNKANMEKETRERQFFMPIAAVIYCLILALFMNRIGMLCLQATEEAAQLLGRMKLAGIGQRIGAVCETQPGMVRFVSANTIAFLLFLSLKRTSIMIFRNRDIDPDSASGQIVSIFYDYDEADQAWYVKPYFGQARSFLKAAYYGGCALSGVALYVSSLLYRDGLLKAPYYPIFVVVIVGEVMFFTDGYRKSEMDEKDMIVSTDRADRIAQYYLLREPLRTLLGDKLSSEGTSCNEGPAIGGAIEDILADVEQNGGHIGKNYAAFIRRKMEYGLKPNIDYVRSGYELAAGKSLLFNTPFYDKLVPYAFYAMNRHLISGGKVLVVLGRHGTEEDLFRWCRRGMHEVSNVPNLWKIAELTDVPCHDDEMPDIGIISRSGVHDLETHRNNLHFLKEVTLVVIIEPSRLVTTAQIGLHLLIKCCGTDRNITFCSVDQNCDGLVDALSHILMTNITEVSATEYPHGCSSYMCWTADGDYVHHRMIPGVSRYLGMGTELSFAALHEQVEKTIWYGGEAFPVLDTHWIAKQYYYDLMSYAKLPTTQEAFDRQFQASFNLCDERVSDVSYITVEDERNNVFEIKRNFATIAEEQGFVNVISSEYMLREYMTDNTELFNADPKAIPFITADYARTKRNAILSICLKLCVEGVTEKELLRELMLAGLSTDRAVDQLWQELCRIFCGGKTKTSDRDDSCILSVVNPATGAELCFEKQETIRFQRRYSVESGQFENIYTIEDSEFAGVILDDLQNAGYIAECDGKDYYLGTELKGHIYQKYLPGQFFTLNGKYYEMISVAAGNRIIVRRASEHITGRLSYRQVRNYTIHRIENSSSMGALKTINGIDLYVQYADFSVETPAYWELRSYQDFENGTLVELNGVPRRSYFNKPVLKLDFSKLGGRFTDEVRKTLTVLLNEAFRTVFADTQPFIAAVTPGEHDLPITYNLSFSEAENTPESCIYLIEDSQLDIGLLISAERNLARIFQIISDYLAWNDDKIEESTRPPEEEKQDQESEKKKSLDDCVADLAEKEPKKSLFSRIAGWFRRHFGRKKKAAPPVPVKPDEEDEPQESLPTEPAPAEDSAGEEPSESIPEETASPEPETEEEAQEVPSESLTEEPSEEPAAEVDAEEAEVSDDEEK